MTDCPLCEACRDLSWTRALVLRGKVSALIAEFMREPAAQISKRALRGMSKEDLDRVREEVARVALDAIRKSEG